MGNFWDKNRKFSLSVVFSPCRLQIKNNINVTWSLRGRTTPPKTGNNFTLAKAAVGVYFRKHPGRLLLTLSFYRFKITTVKTHIMNIYIKFSVYSKTFNLFLMANSDGLTNHPVNTYPILSCGSFLHFPYNMSHNVTHHREGWKLLTEGSWLLEIQHKKTPSSYEEDKSETPWETLCEGMKNTKMNLKRK